MSPRSRYVRAGDHNSPEVQYGFSFQNATKTIAAAGCGSAPDILGGIKLLQRSGPYPLAVLLGKDREGSGVRYGEMEVRVMELAR